MAGVVEVDLLLIGAGPVGLYGAYYAGVRGLRVALVDSLPEPGGQVAAMYPEKPIYDVGGFPSVLGRDLVAGLVAQAGQYHPVYLLGQEALTLAPDPAAPGRWLVGTSAGTTIRTGTVVVTGGIGTFSPRPLPAGEDLLGRGLAYFVPSPAEYAGQHVVVVGGGDSACDWVLVLQPIAASVTLVHRRTAFRAHAATVDAVHRCGATVLVDAQVTALHPGPDGRLAAAEITGRDGTSTVPAQRVVAALGFIADLGPLREWGLDLHDNRHVVVDSRMASTRPGVFAAGDITEYPGKVRLISVGFGEVATAVNNAAVHLDPQAQLFPGHSSDAAPVPAPA